MLNYLKKFVLKVLEQPIVLGLASLPNLWTVTTTSSAGCVRRPENCKNSSLSRAKKTKAKSKNRPLFLHCFIIQGAQDKSGQTTFFSKNFFSFFHNPN
jgi:hypothetical protein